MASDEFEKHWHLDKRVPVAIIACIFAQTLAIGIWVGSIQVRVTNLESRQHVLQETRLSMTERLARLEESVKGMKELLLQINNKLDRALD